MECRINLYIRRNQRIITDTDDIIIQEGCSRSKFLSKNLNIFVKNFREIFPEKTTQQNSDLTALNDAGAIQGMDAREDGVYITYTPVAGADAVTKKLGSTIINLGNGATIDVKAALPNDYAKLTTDNFIAQINSIELGWSTGGRASTTSPKYTLNKSYNPSTGLYTHNAKINRCNADITGGDTRGEGATCWVAISTTTYVIY